MKIQASRTQQFQWVRQTSEEGLMQPSRSPPQSVGIRLQSGDQRDSSQNRRERPSTQALLPFVQLLHGSPLFLNIGLCKYSSLSFNQLDGYVVKWWIPLQCQMKTCIFNASNPILLFTLLSSFNLALNRNSINERAVMELFHFFMIKQGDVKSNSRIVLRTRSYPECQKHETVTRNLEFVSYSRDTYTTDDVIAKTYAKFMRLINLQNRIPIEYL